MAASPSNAGSAQREAKRITEEQAALRRVATLVARNTPEAQVVSAIADSVAELFGTDDIFMLRFDGDRSPVVVASSGRFSDALSVGSRQPLSRDDVAEAARSIGINSVVATPIVVEDRLWGALTIAGDETFPTGTEARLGQFTELLATAIANAEVHARAARLAEEQAALRRVATLAARESSPVEVFGAVTDEMARVLEAEAVGMLRFEPDGTATLVAQSQTPWDPPPLGTRFTLEGENPVAWVHRTAQAARMDDWANATGAVAAMAHVLGVRSSVATPIVVDGRLWGTMIAATSQSEPLPADAEPRIGKFTELVATAISNAESREALTRLADEQAALRRVATLVAQGASAAAVFDAVAAEIEGLLGGDSVSLSRYEPDDAMILIAHRGLGAEIAPAGTRLSLTGENVASKVRRTGQPARMDNYKDSAGPIAKLVRAAGVRCTVGAPIVVEGGVWGLTVSQWGGEHAPPADAEERMLQFAELLGTAIANADNRDQLTASRARLVTEADEARRRVVRDLHDGAQQWLVHAIVKLKLAQRALKAGDGEVERLVGEALRHAELGNAELRELAHGILPAALTRGGLRAGVDALMERLDLPVYVDLPAARLRAEIEASAYFIVAEALTNVMKHSHASRAEVTASVEDDVLHVHVRDDGVGGADTDGRGLVGMADRVTAFGGQLRIDSAAGCGTHVWARFPLSGAEVPAASYR